MKRLLWMLALCTLTGCSLYRNLAQTVILEPIHFAEHLEEKSERRRYRHMATDIYNEKHENCQQRCNTVDFEQGFKDGFVDFMMVGGTVAPPTLPPRKYWTRRYQSPDGHRAAKNWFRGYEQGAVKARDGGYRDLVVIPSYEWLDHVPTTSLVVEGPEKVVAEGPVLLHAENFQPEVIPVPADNSRPGNNPRPEGDARSEKEAGPKTGELPAYEPPPLPPRMRGGNRRHGTGWDDFTRKK